MDFSRITWQQKGGVVTLTLANPPHNSLGRGVLDELFQALVFADASDVDEVVITGQRGFFSAGADIKEELWPIINSRQPFEEGYKFSRRGQELIQYLRRFCKPTTAFIDGYALGGGMELALGCSKIKATKRSRMGLVELTLGVTPGFGGLIFFPRRLGTQWEIGLDCILHGKTLSADDAYRLGLVNELVGGENMSALGFPRKPVSPAIQQYVSNFAGRLSQVPDFLIEEALIHEAFLFGRACAHADARIGIEAFLAGNKHPLFTSIEKTTP